LHYFADDFVKQNLNLTKPIYQTEFTLKKNALFYFIPLILILFLLTNCKSSEKKAASKPKTSTSGTAGRSNDSEKINKVIKTAKSYVGTPYKYGGMTRSGMDCSGLLINSFKAIDYQLPARL